MPEHASAQHPTRAHPPSTRPAFPFPARVVIGAFAVILAVSWLLTVLTASDLVNLLGTQLTGATPVSRFVYVGLVGLMMVAMMLPSAIPMIVTYRGLLLRSEGLWESNSRTVLFSTMYFLVWSLSIAPALVALMAFGLMGNFLGFYVIVPGIVLAAAGLYQFTSWKQYCLSKCRTPLGFLITNWRSGRWGALRMGADHSAYCLGCCWLLMAVVFVTGEMSLLWMGVFSGLILAEKLWGRGEWFSRLLGGTSVAIGGAITAFALFSFPLS